jgi:hypothetical protein
MISNLFNQFNEIMRAPSLIRLGQICGSPGNPPQTANVGRLWPCDKHGASGRPPALPPVTLATEQPVT